MHKSLLHAIRRNAPHNAPEPLLLVIAHPDDETMFFGPTVRHCVRHGSTTHVLCLSTGNFQGLGARRSTELRHSCAVLGVDPAHVHIVDDPGLPDSPTAPWPDFAVARHVVAALQATRAGTVLTFDAHGVSGHPNHRATHAGVVLALQQDEFKHGVLGFQLESVSLVRKYLGILDWPICVAQQIFSRHANGTAFSKDMQFTVVSDVRDWLSIQMALGQHASQMVWFRQLYRLFSRYLLVNTIQPLAHARQANAR